MMKYTYLKIAIAGCLCGALLATGALAHDFNIPGGDLMGALDAYMKQAGVALMYSSGAVKGVRTRGVKGDLPADAALLRILKDTGFATRQDSSGAIAIVRDGRVANDFADDIASIHEAAATAPTSNGAALETVTVTSSKIGGDIQNIPISITALSQEQLTATQTAGGPDLVKQVPNLTFSKTNFSGYNIQIRGIGTQAISVTTDPAVAVAFNDIPFIRNHFFEQEFYDVSQVEVLRGPQGTLYGRNATAGVVNLVSAKPSDQFEALASVDIGNYQNRRLEAMLNVPIVDDRLDLRVAGEWTKRNGYTFDPTLGTPVDGRDLWSGRVTLGWKPSEKIQTYFVWEHFSEDDDRLRSGKTLCTTDPGPSSVDGPAGLVTNIDIGGRGALSQGCLPRSLYGPSAFEQPNYFSLPFISAAENLIIMVPGFNPTLAEQAPSLRTISSTIRPNYRAKNDTLEFNADYKIAPSLTLTSQTAYNKDFLYSTEDYNRFAAAPGAFAPTSSNSFSNYDQANVGADGEFCDPQLGCSDKVLGEDVSQEHAEQFYQEVRLASDFSGPLNFSLGGNYLHYQTIEDYFVFFNVITLIAQHFNGAGCGESSVCDNHSAAHVPFDAALANACSPGPANPNYTGRNFGLGCAYVDPNPLSQIDGQGHNYFRSENPYRLNSYAGFGEVYYQVAPDVKLTGGLRWTDDQKSFDVIPSWTIVRGEGYPVTGVLDQQWKELTGRFNATWTPKLDFTDQSLFYGSYSRGYKGGGANPPGVIAINGDGIPANSPSNFTHPLTFKPEFVDAFELGTKNTLLDGSMTFNGDVFYYKYQNYQISEIVDRTAVNLNFNTTVKGAEVEATWEPMPGLRFNLAGGYENATLDNGSQAIDLMDRTAGHAGWMVVKPFVTQTSNCILPTSVVNGEISAWRAFFGGNNLTPVGGDPSVDAVNFATENDGNAFGPKACFYAYSLGLDPVTLAPYQLDPPTDYAGNPVPGYHGFDPTTAPNNGEGFTKNLSGNQLPNTPPFTLSTGAQYTMPLSADWAGTLRGDFYWQGNSFARVFNDRPYDQLHGYTNLNLSLIFTNQDGWQAMAYVKNVFNVTAITGAFLNSDDTALTTNVFLTDPRLFGVRLTKNW